VYDISTEYVLQTITHEIFIADGSCSVSMWIHLRLGRFTRMLWHITLLVCTGEHSSSLMRYVYGNNFHCSLLAKTEKSTGCLLWSWLCVDTKTTDCTTAVQCLCYCLCWPGWFGWACPVHLKCSCKWIFSNKHVHCWWYNWYVGIEPATTVRCSALWTTFEIVSTKTCTTKNVSHIWS